MKNSVGDIATHELKNSKSKLTKTGNIIRKYSLDEIPQLINIIKGEMNFVGPRPALYNQRDLINLRNKKKIYTVKPGITGWAQVNGRDEISIARKVTLDEYYLNNRSLSMNIKILFITAYRIIKPRNILH